MRDWTQRGTFINTYWKQTGAAPNRTEWTLFGIGLGEDGSDKVLGVGPDHVACLIAAQQEIKINHPGRFI